MPETSIVVKSTDRYSDAIKKMSSVTKSFSKDVDKLEDTLYALNKNKITMKMDLSKAKSELKAAEKQFDLTHSAADGLKLELAQANYDNMVRNLKAVTSAARETEKAISKAENSADSGGGGTSFGKSVINALAVSGIGDAAKQILSQGANAIAGSALGDDGGSMFSSALSTAATGASAGFMVGGPAGAAIGAAIGTGVGLVSGGIQILKSATMLTKTGTQGCTKMLAQLPIQAFPPAARSQAPVSRRRWPSLRSWVVTRPQTPIWTVSKPWQRPPTILTTRSQGIPSFC